MIIMMFHDQTNTILVGLSECPCLSSGEKIHKETCVLLFYPWSSFLEAGGLQLHHAKGFALFRIDPVILS